MTARAAAGDLNPLRPLAATLLVYDTVAFREVTSRLHRAAGMVRGEAALLAKAVDRGTPPDRLPDRLLTLDLIAEAAARLSLAGRLDGRTTPCGCVRRVDRAGG